MKVVHCKKEQYDVYIGRPGPWGNSYSHLAGTKAQHQVSTREEAIERYEADMRLIPIDGLRALLSLIAGKTLGCWCAPSACHGDVLVKLCRELELIK